MSSYKIFLLAASFVAVNALSLGDSCPNVKILSDFDARKYVGTWYEIQKFPLIFEANQKCIAAVYSPLDATSVKVNNTGYDYKSNKWVGTTGKAYAPNSSEPGRLIVQLHIGPIQTKGDYWVLDTDYTTYSIVYSCQKELVFKTEFAWILARERTLDPKTIALIKETITKYGIDVTKFLITDQSNCP